MENKNNESDDSCCIVEERIHERCEGSDDSDCCIIEDDEESISEGIVNENIENIEAHSANDAVNSSENGKTDMELDGKVVNDDDDCCIIEDWEDSDFGICFVSDVSYY